MHLDLLGSHTDSSLAEPPPATEHPVAGQYTCQWSIANFQHLYFTKNATVLSFLQSDTFSPFTDEAQCGFFLRIHPNVAPGGTHLSLHLHAEFTGHLKELDVTCRLALIDMDKEKCHVQCKFTFRLRTSGSRDKKRAVKGGRASRD